MITRVSTHRCPAVRRWIGSHDDVNGCGTDIDKDQRGEDRPIGYGCDIGAYEVTDVVDLGLTVSGNGLVRVLGTSFECQGACEETFAAGKSLTLEAVASEGARFLGWEGSITGTARVADIVANDALDVVARFKSPIIVNETADELRVDGDCSLREAIKSANTDTGVDACFPGVGWDVVAFSAPGTYRASSLSIENDNVTIEGHGMGQTVIDLAGESLIVDPSDDRIAVSMRDLTLRPAAITNHARARITGLTGEGLTLARVEVAGGTYHGIENHGALIVRDSVISGHGVDGIRNVSASVTIERSTIKLNGGRGLSSTGAGSSFSLRDSTVKDNRPGTGCHSNDIFVFLELRAACGGGVLNGAGSRGSIRRSTISNNVADFGWYTVDGAGGGLKSDDDNIVIENSTFSGNRSSGPGGGLYFGTAANEVWDIDQSTIVDNQSGTGGGGVHLESGELQVSGSILAGNSNTDCSGGLHLVSRNLIKNTAGCTLSGASRASVLNTSIGDDGFATTALDHRLLDWRPDGDGSVVVVSRPQER